MIKHCLNSEWRGRESYYSGRGSVKRLTSLLNCVPVVRESTPTIVFVAAEKSPSSLNVSPSFCFLIAFICVGLKIRVSYTDLPYVQCIIE